MTYEVIVSRAAQPVRAAGDDESYHCATWRMEGPTLVMTRARNVKDHPERCVGMALVLAPGDMVSSIATPEGRP